MRVVLADVEAAPLEQAACEIDPSGSRALPVRTDVSQAADVERLAQVAQDTFGRGGKFIRRVAGRAVRLCDL